MIKKINLLVASLLMVIANLSMAGTLPSHYAENEFSGIGTIDNINSDAGTIVIGDRFFLLDEAVIVRSLRKQSVSNRKLKLGTEAAYKLASENGNHQIIIESGSHQLISQSGSHQLITEIWLLPKGYI